MSVGEGPRGQELGEGERQHQEVHAADEGGRLTASISLSILTEVHLTSGHES